MVSIYLQTCTSNIHRLRNCFFAILFFIQIFVVRVTGLKLSIIV